VLTLLRPARTTPVLGDVALLIARIAIGFVLLAHGWQKYSEYTIDGTTAAFADMGVPAAGAAALFATVVEVVGGVALILGLLTPVAAALNIVNLLGALVLVHASNGVFVDGGGYELVLVLIAGLLLVLALGAGRFSVDELLARRTTDARRP
jgi:putative oxidoreductase